MTNPVPESQMSAEDLRATLEVAEIEFIQIAEKLTKLQAKEQKIRKKCLDLEKNLRRKGHAFRVVHECLLIRSCLPKKVTGLRKKYLDLLNKVASPDITVRKQDVLQEEIDSVLEQLQRVCSHPFILVTRDLYRGSQSDDYDDAHPSHRECMVCGISESSLSSCEDTFEILCNDPEARLVKRDLRRCGGANHKISFVFFKLLTVRKIFFASAGNMNIDDSAWSEDKSKKEKKAA